MAAIGSVIGHELGHTIDDKGCTFDHRGRVRPWLSDKDKEKFFALAQPLIAQFDSAGQNGKFTLGENIGDLVGLSNSYNAAFPPDNTKPQKLKQEFFLQYARLWCQVQRPAYKEYRLKVDPHAQEETRTNEQVKHQPAFAEAFNCTARDPLVLPLDKVIRIW